MSDLVEPTTFWQVARRPRWIAALVLALALAAGFAWLGQWQLGRSIQSATDVGPNTEKVVPLSSIAKPRTPFTDTQLGRMITVQAQLATDDFVLLSGRQNGGVVGWWLVGHATTDDGDELAVALGWAPTRAAALAAEPSASIDTPLIGRYLPSESPDQPGVEKGEQTAAAVPAFINQWSSVNGPVYSGYVVVQHAPSGLDAIDSPPPIVERDLNWLNLFYAAEWIIFAGFAIFFWYRLVKDAKEKEDEERELALAAEADSLGESADSRTVN